MRIRHLFGNREVLNKMAFSSFRRLEAMTARSIVTEITIPAHFGLISGPFSAFPGTFGALRTQ
jgi:hypothetical protein